MGFGKSYDRKIEITYYVDVYERAVQRIKSPYGQPMRKKRQSTFELVFSRFSPVYGLAQNQHQGHRKSKRGYAYECGGL
jgi:hypothetical protein